MDRISRLIKAAGEINGKMGREFRRSAVEVLYKSAQANGILGFSENVLEYPTRLDQTLERGGDAVGRERKDLYGIGPEHKPADLSVKEVSRHLSTRYSPDHVGVSVRRISDGVYQDPITNKIYDWNEGFKTDEGDVFAGGNVSLQTDIFSR